MRTPIVQLDSFSKQQAKTGEPVKVIISRELAKSILKKWGGRPVSPVQMGIWTTRILTNNFVSEKSLLLFNEVTFELSDGSQRLFGFIESGKQELETYVYFCGDKNRLTKSIVKRFYKP